MIVETALCIALEPRSSLPAVGRNGGVHTAGESKIIECGSSSSVIARSKANISNLFPSSSLKSQATMGGKTLAERLQKYAAFEIQTSSYVDDTRKSK